LKLAVIGAGAAGTAAAWAAARAGVEVVTFAWQSGATALYSGALDMAEWDAGGVVSALDADVIGFAAALETWFLAQTPCRVATMSGVVRPALGIDRALLDLAPLAGRSVAVADIDRDDWDGPLLARSLASSDWAADTRTRFDAVKLNAVLQGFERRIAVYDFAALFDPPERAAALAAELDRSIGNHDAWLLGPWLGTSHEVCARMRGRMKTPVGETTSPPGGPAGARFEQARNRLLAASGVEVREAKVNALEPRFTGWTLHFTHNGTESMGLIPETFEADAVVLAVGGVAGGGIRLVAGAAPQRRAASFGLSLRAPVVFELDEHDLDCTSSPYGVDFQTRGASALERLGVAANRTQVRGQPGLLVAGDVAAGRPRTALEAVRSGLSAVRAVLATAQRISNRPSARPSTIP